MLSAVNNQTRKDQEEELSTLDKKLETETAELDRAFAQWKDADTLMEEFGRILDHAFNLAGCSNAGIVALLGNYLSN
jgi:exonuclease VII small subunit